MKRIKIHFYGLRYYFLVFLLLFISYSLISLTLIKNNYVNLLPILYAFLLVSVLILGIYEYNRIAHMHRAILTNRKPFYMYSLIFGLICNIIVIGIFICYSLLINHFHMVDISFIDNPYFYILNPLFMYSTYLIGNLYGLTLAKFHKLNNFSIIILFGLIIYFSIKIDDMINFVSKIVYLDFNFNLYIIIFIATIIIVSILNKYIFSKKD